MKKRAVGFFLHGLNSIIAKGKRLRRLHGRHFLEQYMKRFSLCIPGYRYSQSLRLKPLRSISLPPFEQTVTEMDQSIEKPNNKALAYLEKTGLLQGYECTLQTDLLTSLCENGLPTGDLYEFAALMILKFEKRWKTQQRKQAIQQRTFLEQAKKSKDEPETSPPPPKAEASPKRTRPEEAKAKAKEEGKAKEEAKAPKKPGAKPAEEAKGKAKEEAKAAKPEEAKARRPEEAKAPKPEEAKAPKGKPGAKPAEEAKSPPVKPPEEAKAPAKAGAKKGGK
jgi:hypothetical protein